jgi:small conductance mechanosensitive channel
MIVKAQVMTRPLQQWHVARRFHFHLKRKMDETGMRLPLPQMRIYTSGLDGHKVPHHPEGT